LRIDAVKALQQSWQVEAQSVPLDRKLEQKLWESFRQPIDQAFQRKTTEREQVASQLSAHDRAVLEASKALEGANASGDASRIRSAMQALDDALRGQAVAVAAEQAAASEVSSAPTPVSDDGASAEAVDAPPPVVAPKAARPVVAVRGDDRPGQKKTEQAAAGRGSKFGDRPGSRDGRPSERGPRPGDRGDRFERIDRGPRLGDAAFRAQREALEHAEMALRKLASQAHGETLWHLLSAWENRQADALPTAQDLGKGVNAATRASWVQAVAQAPQGQAQSALLRLEMAAEVPTPAEFLNERRSLQLQLLTQRNQPGPQETWRQDVAAVLSAPHDGTSARRLHNVLKPLLRR
jgi:hypothetical protein